MKWSCNSNMCVSSFMCILKIKKKLSNNDHLPWVVTFVIGARWHHVTKGRCRVVVLSSFLKLWLVSHLELFKSILSPMLHFLLSHPFVMPSFCSFFCGSYHFVWTSCSIHCFIPVKHQWTTHTRRNVQIIWNKDSVVIELKVIFYAITELVITF